MTDPFLFQVIAYLELTKDNTHLDTFIKGGYSFRFVDYLPGYPLIISLLSRLGDIPPEQILFLPVSLILLPVAYFALAQRLFGSTVLSCLFALYSVYDISLASHYNVFAYTWSNTIYLSFAIVSIELLQGRDARKTVLLFLLFGGSVFLHYATTLWLIVFAVAWNALMILSDRTEKSNDITYPGGSYAMPLAFIVMFLTVNRMFYNVWLPDLATASSSGGADPISLLTAKVASYFGHSTTSTEEFLQLDTWGGNYGRWRLGQLLLLFGPLLAVLPAVLIRFVRRRSVLPSNPAHLYMAITIAVTAIVDWLVYGSYQGINMRYVSLMFPFLAVIAVAYIAPNKPFRVPLMFAITATASVCFVIAARFYSQHPPTSLATTAHGSTWFLQNTQGSVLTFLDLQGLALVVAAENDQDFPTSYLYDSELYGSLVDPNRFGSTQSTHDYQHVLIDAGALERPLHGFSNRVFRPLSDYLEEIEGNDTLMRVYDDGLVWVLTRSSPPLRK